MNNINHHQSCLNVPSTPTTTRTMFANKKSSKNNKNNHNNHNPNNNNNHLDYSHSIQQHHNNVHQNHRSKRSAEANLAVSNGLGSTARITSTSIVNGNSKGSSTSANKNKTNRKYHWMHLLQKTLTVSSEYKLKSSFPAMDSITAMPLNGTSQISNNSIKNRNENGSQNSRSSSRNGQSNGSDMGSNDNNRNDAATISTNQNEIAIMDSVSPHKLQKQRSINTVARDLFDASKVQYTNITAQVGHPAYIPCVIDSLGDKMVRFLLEFLILI